MSTRLPKASRMAVGTREQGVGLDARREVSDLLRAFDVSIGWSRCSLDYMGLFTLSKFTKPSIYDMWTIKLSLESLSSLKKKKKKKYIYGQRYHKKKK